jgi:lysophospholipase L1-like esterase
MSAPAHRVKTSVPPSLAARAAIVLVVAAFGAGILSGAFSAPGGAIRDFSAAALAASSPTADPDASPSASPTSSPAPTPTPSPPPLPSLLGAIGDSFTQGFDISPLYPNQTEYPQYSWVVGWARNDGVFSLRERLEALGAQLAIVDAATASRTMADAPRQARQVVAGARKLLPGQTALVTIELGTNDICHWPKTSAATYESQFRSAMDILVNGLPVDSYVVVMAMPDLAHIHDLIQADRPVRLYFQRSDNTTRCAPFAGADSPMSYDQAVALMNAYNASLDRVCGEVEARYGTANIMHCISDPAALAEKDFTIDDLSRQDHFHFTFSGQSKMADAAWKVCPWADLALPADAPR